METTASIDQVFFAIWDAPKDKGGNLAQFENLAFFSDDPTIATIVQATPEELTAYNALWPEEGEGSENRIPVENQPFTGKVASTTKVGATSVGIKVDKKIGEAVENVESRLTVTNVAGEVATLGEPRLTPAKDNLETEG